MKKLLFYSTFILISFFAACDTSEKAEVKSKDGTTVKEPVPNTIVDTTRKTSVSVGSGGAAVKHKNTEVNVDKNGVKIGTKDVKIEVKK